MNFNAHIPVTQQGSVTSTSTLTFNSPSTSAPQATEWQHRLVSTTPLVSNIMLPPTHWASAPPSRERLISSNIQPVFDQSFSHSHPASLTHPGFFPQPNQNMSAGVATSSHFPGYFRLPLLHSSARQPTIFTNPFSLYPPYVNQLMHGVISLPNTAPWHEQNFNHRFTPYAKPEQCQSRSENRSYPAGKTRTSLLEFTQLKKYQGDNKEVVKILESLQKKPVVGKVLFIRQQDNKGLGFFETGPYCIKFDFSINKADENPPRNIDQRDLRISGTFEFDNSKMSEYVKKHQPGAFRQLKSQKERGENIPIHMIGTSLYLSPESIPHQIKIIGK